MKYVNVNEIAAKWNLSERSVRNYCAHGKIPGVRGCRKAGQKETSGKNSK